MCGDLIQINSDAKGICDKFATAQMDRPRFGSFGMYSPVSTRVRIVVESPQVAA